MPDNRPTDPNTKPGTCPIQMFDRKACGRPLIDPKPEEDDFAVCLMHSHNRQKNKNMFANEISGLISGSSPHRRKGSIDFSHFVFVDYSFRGFTFPAGEISFSHTHFYGKADFKNTSFQGKILFDHAHFEYALFNGSTFHSQTTFQDASFNKAIFFQTRFLQKTSFVGGEFQGETNFNNSYFQEVDFSGRSFRGKSFFQNVDLKKSDFSQANFFKNASFLASRITSSKFFRTIFWRNASFWQVRFLASTHFNETWFLTKANFRETFFEKPNLVHFFRVNQPINLSVKEQRDPPSGLRIFLNGSQAENLHIEDVNWNRLRRRMILQDEAEIRDGDSSSFELTSNTYRRLTNNFEHSRQYDLAEDCFVGTMEMKRLDPDNFLWGRHDWTKKLYAQSKVMRTFGELVSVTNLYHIFSNYGSNYIRALVVLFGLLGVFGILYSLPGFGLSPTSDMAFLEGPYLEGGYSWQQFIDGLLYAFEVITFTREPTFTVTNYPGKAVRILETIFVPAQLALFFLALRRRFRR